jgi:hypothetical protein
LIDAHFEHDKEGFVVTYAGEKIKEIISEVYENGLAHFCDVAKKKILYPKGALYSNLMFINYIFPQIKSIYWRYKFILHYLKN